jgi:hypothetical protein
VESSNTTHPKSPPAVTLTIAGSSTAPTTGVDTLPTTTTANMATHATVRSRETECPETPARLRLGRISFKNDMHQVSATPADWWSGLGKIDHSNDTNDHFEMQIPMSGGSVIGHLWNRIFVAQRSKMT